ncbi:MAG: HD domain-containing protein [Candidatus Latescibacteria bacterium]|nr:HD domain-containing protein [bacterium]MBD3422970.1 HD domain-containing protein [Candidatus Latescibacterota bacterium]
MKLDRELFKWEEALMEKGRLYLVGGAVRDLLIGTDRAGFDRDYLLRETGLDEAVSVLSAYGKCDLVGKSFGVLKFSPPDSSTVDIALPRREFSTGWGHKQFEVSFSPELPVEEDLIRRDFTMNSIALDLGNMELIDPLDGAGDIERLLMRVNREGAFREDPLRIIRGVQFKYRFGLEVEEKTGVLMKSCAHLVTTVTAERVREELNKMMLLADNPGDGFAFMHEIGVLQYIIPELDETYGIEQNEYHPDDIFNHSIKSCNLAEADLVLRWAALLHDIGKKETKKRKDGRTVFYSHEIAGERKAEGVLRRLKFSRSFTGEVIHLIRNHMFVIDRECSDGAVRRFVSRVGTESLEKLFALRRADALSRGDTESVENIEYVRGRIEKVSREDAAFKVQDLDINGSDVMEITGLSQGKKVGEILDYLFERVLDEPTLNNREILLKMVERRYGK